MNNTIQLPKINGGTYTYKLIDPISIAIPKSPFKKRIAYSAAHVVADPFSGSDPINSSEIDWKATLEYRHYLWSLGFGVAEAMDTAQRGMGLDWDKSKELIRRSVKEARAVNGRIASGVGTDHLLLNKNLSLDTVEKAYEEQCEFVEKQGSKIILMASRALVLCANSHEDYEKVYSNVLQKVSQPVILHWLGDVFDPALKGYWGYENIDKAMEVCLRIIKDNESKIDGIKISLLDKEKEIKMRRLLPKNVKMYTGDDYNYPELIQGDEQGYSHALLGVFDAIAPIAASAMHALDNNDIKSYYAYLEKTIPLARHIFEYPTYAYKVGVVFLAYLNGHQSHFRMLGGAEGQRSIIHLSELFVMANEAGLLRNPEMATERMKSILFQSGVK